MPRKIHDLEFPLAFSQEDLHLLEGLLLRHPRTRVLDAALALLGVPKAAIAAQVRVHPTFINQLFKADALSSAHHRILTDLGLPGVLLSPERDGAAA